MKIDALLAKMNEITSTADKTVKWSCSVYPKNAKKVIKKLNEADEAKLKTIQLFTSDEYEVNKLTGQTQKSKGTAIFADMLGSITLFTKEELIEALQESHDEMVKTRATNRINTTKQNLFIEHLKSNNPIVEEAIELSIPVAASDYTKADKEFFKWWCRDSENNIYMRLKDGSTIPVPFVEGQETKIAPNNAFWTLFFKEHRNDIRKWDSIITTKGWAIYNEEEDVDTKNIYEVYHEEIPRCFLNAVMLVATFESVETDKECVKYLKNISCEAKVGSSGHVVASESALRKNLAYTMADIDISELDLMKTITNDYGVAMFNIPYSIWKTEEKVKIPEIWKKFLDSKFKISPKDQYYRLANFMISMVDASNFSRQALVIAGEGNDGKSSLCEAISTYFNGLTKKQFVAPCNPNGMRSDNTQNGLVDCLNSHVIVIPDVRNISDVMNDDIFKNITGGDTIQCQKKYSNPIKKNMAGTKLILTTNDRVFLPNTFATTRCIPLYFTPRDKDERDWNITKLKKELVETMPDFLKWCYWYSTNVNKKYGIEAGNTMIFSIENSEKSEKECFEELYTKEQKFYYMTFDEYSDEDTSYFTDFFETYYEASDNNEDFIPKEKLFNDWLLYATDHNLEKVYTIRPKSSDLRKLYKTFRNLGVVVDMVINVNGSSKKVLGNIKVKSDYPVCAGIDAKTTFITGRGRERSIPTNFDEDYVPFHEQIA